MFGDLAPGADATLTIDVTLKSGAEDGDTILNPGPSEDAIATACWTDGGCTTIPDVTVMSNEGNAVEVVVSDCNLDITKEAEDDSVLAGDDITYDIAVTNEEEGCVNPTITDELTEDLDCQDVDVDVEGDLTCHATGCSGDDITVKCTGVLEEDDQIDVTFTAETDEDIDVGDVVHNKACVEGAEGIDTKECATETVEIEKEATPIVPPPITPPVNIVTPVPTVPAAAPLPTLAAPPTGTGPESSSTSWALPIGLGLGGLCLIALSGTALAKKRTR